MMRLFLPRIRETADLKSIPLDPREKKELRSYVTCSDIASPAIASASFLWMIPIVDSELLGSCFSSSDYAFCGPSLWFAVKKN